MNALPFLKRDKKEEEVAPRANVSEKRPAVSEVKSSQRSERKKTSPELSFFLKRPHVSEKATRRGAHQEYIFETVKHATKPQIAKEIESLFSVKVEKVRIVNVPGKAKRLGRTEGWQPGYKKAIISLKEGKIELG